MTTIPGSPTTPKRRRRRGPSMTQRNGRRTTTPGRRGPSMTQRNGRRTTIPLRHGPSTTPGRRQDQARALGDYLEVLPSFNDASSSSTKLRGAKPRAD